MPVPKTDWRALTLKLDEVAAMSDAAFDELLLRLDSESPATADLARRHRSRARLARSFMQTSVGGEAAPAPTALEQGTEVGVWRIEQLIGAGGMGEVYRADRCDGLYEQTVALKVMAPGDKARLRRFQLERRRLARMDHPGISRIIDGGTAGDGRPYMAMELVDGRPIDRYACDQDLPLRERLRLFVELCDAVAHAHGKLILHRDLKAGNVLVDSGGTVRLIDFGIAALLDADELEGAAPLTFASAAPEQLSGAAVSVATDVFALGVLLHQLTTGDVPPRGPSGAVEIDAGMLGDHDLAAIVQKATASEPDRRYPSAEALRDDVTAILEHRPVEARAGSIGYRIGRFVLRHPAANALGAALIVAVLAGLISSLVFAVRAAREAEEARVALQRSEFYLDRANLWLNTQSAYADILQRLFGGDTDVERLTGIMLERWREAHEMPDKDEEATEHASLLSYIVGRHFLFRNDYASAVRVLEQWQEAGYGEEDVLSRGKHLLAIAYLNVGRTAEAAHLLREVEAHLGSSYDAYSSDHAAAAAQLAHATEDRADVLKAEDIVTRVLDNEDDALTIGFLLHQLGKMHRLRGDLEGAYAAMLRLDRYLEENTLTEISGRDTARLDLAAFELYYTGDLDRAQELAQSVLDGEAHVRGESLEAGRALEIVGLVAASRGDLSGAAATLRHAAAVTERYAGRSSPASVGAVMSLVEVLADLGRTEEAADLWSDVAAGIGDVPADDSRRCRLALAELHLLARGGNITAAQARAGEALPGLETIGRDPALLFRYRRLSELGVVPPMPARSTGDTTDSARPPTR